MSRRPTFDIGDDGSLAHDPPPVKPRVVPIYRELADEIQKLIEEGSLRVGQKLPSVRTSARQRQIGIGTVMQAYVVLENRGLIEARPKSGYYVRSRQAVKPRSVPGCILGPAVAIAEKDLAEHMIDLALDPSYFPLGTAFADPRILPLERVSKAAASIGRSDPGIFGRYAMGRPYPAFVQELSRRYLNTGTALSQDQFIVTSSCTEALHLALRALTVPGDTVIIESPAYFGFLRLIASCGLEAVEVPVDARRGLSLEALSVALDSHDAKALIVTPNLHNPTGACMPNARKEELYRILCDHDLPAIEDDIYADLHFGTVRPKPLKAWDRDGRVLLCSSLSKTLAPGLGLGWIAAGRYHSSIDDGKWSTAPLYPQKVAARFMQEGYDRQLRRQRSEYKRQVELVSRAVRTYFPPGTEVSEPQGGFVLWVECPRVDMLRVRQEALVEKISTAPGTIFSIRGAYRNCLRLNCGIAWSPAYEQVIRTLGRLMARQLEQRPGEARAVG